MWVCWSKSPDAPFPPSGGSNAKRVPTRAQERFLNWQQDKTRKEATYSAVSKVATLVARPHAVL